MQAITFVFSHFNQTIMNKIRIQKLSTEDLEQMQIKSWPIWEKEVSNFDWEYADEEECYILEGEVEVSTDEGMVKIQPGDFVTFKKGLQCEWNILKPIRKHYNFK
tara:strand:+ start:421 stop:735 length:315 start_codon:yes stop_codon:yes gene_type:complete